MNGQDPRSIGEIKAALSAATSAEVRRIAAGLSNDPRSGVADAVRQAIRKDVEHKTERRRLSVLYQLEVHLAREGHHLVAGVDEVGRGALAGPLSAGACILPSAPRIEGIDDSKRLTPLRRTELAIRIKEVAVSWSVAHVPAHEIDALGVTAALRRAMGRALAGLEVEPDHVVIDGRPMGVAAMETAVVKGDSKVAAVAAASILAKVERDALMTALAREHPAYGFDINKGYGTAEHAQAIDDHGMCPLHRRSFCAGHGMDRLF